MPNWCNNSLTIYHHDEMDIGRVAGKLGPALNIQKDRFEFQDINPVPEELLVKESKDSNEFTCIDQDLDILFEQQGIAKDWENMYDVDHSAYPFKNHYPKDFLEPAFVPEYYLKNKFGVTTAYEYRCEHWGTKWDGIDLDVDIKAKEILLTFNTAWSPPLIIIETIIGWFPKNSFKFYAFEPACGLLSKIQGEEMGTVERLDVDMGKSKLTEEEYQILIEADKDYANEWYEKDKDGSYKYKEDDIPYDY